ncbi:MAG TPA: GGDEF domain-containing protein [Candidatus Dormibacteraeota bacterium]|nr:GGDEF domain-containing protein [Candidatus Dormibacteraeota bacterium]
MGTFALQSGRKWTTWIGTLVCVHVVLSLVVKRGFALTAFGDILQNVVLLLATVAFLANIRTASPKSRLFWALMSLGLAMWLVSQVMWTYIEVYLRHEAPNPFVGDVILFLHIVPMMAAVALQPHTRQDDHTIRVGTLDFALLLTWWLFLYLFVVIPWQYVQLSETAYGRSFDLLYVSEELVLAGGLLLVWRRSVGAWRSIYFHLFGATMLYCVASLMASEAIDLHLYYTGSLLDVPLVASMAWFVRIAFLARDGSAQNPSQEAATRGFGIWKARLAMVAVFVTPLMMAWAQFAGNVPQRVRTYRLFLTVAVMLVMGVLVFLKQHLLDQELLSLLRLSRHNLDEMCRLKDELENKEQSLRWHSLELQRKNLELQEISFTDVLTGVWNRRYMEEILTAEAGQVLRNYQRARGSGIRKMDHRDLVFIMVDMDFFKEVNDVHGHPAGDRLLQLVAQRLSTVVRKSDVLVRWGGEEFLIMSRSTDPSGTPAFCSRVLEVISSEPFDLGHGISIEKTCSVGWAAYPWCRGAYEALCAEESIELADAALYRAKALGRNQGVGIVAGEGASLNPEAIELRSVRDGKPPLARTIETPCPDVASTADAAVEPAEHADKFKL